MTIRRQEGLSVWSIAAVAVMVVLTGSVVFLSAAADQSALVADLPLVVPGLGWTVPAIILHWIFPLVLSLCHLGLNRERIFTPLVRWLLSLAGVVGLGTVWLVDLVRHDRWLSLFHCALILSIFLPWQKRPFSTPRLTPPITVASVLGLVSYGAIWGETRCNEPSPVSCVVDGGLRVWVPKILGKFGVPVFADLRGADLSGLQISGRDLRYGDLSGADLSRANLVGANLRRARLDDISAAESSWRSAYMDGATMVGAYLLAADLQGVHGFRLDLRDADLSRAILRRASLSHAYLGRARFDGAAIHGTYLRFVEGLVPGQLDGACGDRDTLLPPGVSVPMCRAP